MKILHSTLLMCLAVAVLLLPTSCSTPVPFQKDIWLRGVDESGNSRRVKMITDLKNRYLRIGMSRSDVIMLLGKPDSSSALDKQCNIERYSLGLSNETDGDPDQLVLKFDLRGNLININVDEG